MREGQKRWAKGALWLATGILCWCAAASLLATWDARWVRDRISYRAPGGAVSGEDLAALRKQIGEAGGGYVTGWAQQLAQSVAAPGTNGSAQVDVLWVDGGTALIFTPRLVHGQMPAQGDDRGCALDRRTALALYGTADVVGRTLTLGGVEIEIRGVYDLPEGFWTLGTDPGRGLLLAPSAVAAEAVDFTAIEFILHPQDGETMLDTAVDAMRGAGLSTSGAWEDYTDGRDLASAMTDAPTYLLALLVVIELAAAMLAFSKTAAMRWAALRENRLTPGTRYARLFAVWAGGALLLLGLGALALSMLPPFRTIPPAYMPTRWSDFDFWPGLFQQIATDAAKQALSVALRPDWMRAVLINWLAALLAAAACCLWHGWRRLRRGAARIGPLFASLWIVPLCLSPLVALSICARSGCTPGVSPPMLLLPCLLYLTVAALRAARLPARGLHGAERFL